jgi:DNA-binding NtrC family response regulator
MNVPRRILHVDDDPQITQLVAEYLRDHGLETVQLHDPCAVLHGLARFQERVMLLDIDMPGLNGIELLKAIKSFDGGIQVVMLTGMVTMTTVLQSFRFGAEACFFKPIEKVDPLAETLEYCFRKIDRWWMTLDELRRRKVESETPAEFVPVLPCTD